MRTGMKYCVLLLVAALMLSGCSMRTVDEMYRLPKRSENYNDLQSAVEGSMQGLEYCAPLTGENQQTVQMVDLDGDGVDEYLLFAKGSQEKPLRILVFRNENDEFVNVATAECNGSAFDQVEYIDMNGDGGFEIVVGRQLSDQVIRSVSVYTMVGDELNQLISVNYTKLLTADLDGDGLSELFLLRPGETETDRGVAELYSMKNGVIERFNEVDMSQPADKLKRIISGKLSGGKTAIYTACAVGDTALVTDIFAVADGKLNNLTLTNETDTNIRTMRNFYVYADDIDNDGIVELPSLITMYPLGDGEETDMHHLIRWYAMNPDGSEVDKMFTYHDFVSGWYLQVDSGIANHLVAKNQGNQTDFYIWDNGFTSTQKLMSIYAFTGQNREEQGLSDGRFILYKTDSVVYSALLEPNAIEFDFTQEKVVYNFRLIQKDWKTGET